MLFVVLVHFCSFFTFFTVLVALLSTKTLDPPLIRENIVGFYSFIQSLFYVVDVYIEGRRYP